jgi:hypothetical protein
MRATSASLRRAIRTPPASNISFDHGPAVYVSLSAAQLIFCQVAGASMAVCAERVGVLLLLRINNTNKLT